MVISLDSDHGPAVVVLIAGQRAVPHLCFFSLGNSRHGTQFRSGCSQKKAGINVPARLKSRTIAKPDQAFSFFLSKAIPQTLPPNIAAVAPPSGTLTALGVAVPPPFGMMGCLTGDTGRMVTGVGKTPTGYAPWSVTGMGVVVTPWAERWEFPVLILRAPAAFRAGINNDKSEDVGLAGFRLRLTWREAFSDGLTALAAVKPRS